MGVSLLKMDENYAKLGASSRPAEAACNRRTSRGNAGKEPDRHGEVVNWDKLFKSRKKQPLKRIVENRPGTPIPRHTVDYPLVPTTRRPLSPVMSERNCIAAGPRTSKSSKSSSKTDGSTVKSQAIQAQIRTQERMNELATEEAKIIERLQMLKLEQIQREKSIAELNLKLEKAKLEEKENFFDDSQDLGSEDDDLPEDFFIPEEDEERPRTYRVDQRDDESMKSECQGTNSGLMQHFEAFSQAMVNAMTKVNQEANQSNDVGRLIGRQVGAKQLPQFSGEPKEWPMFLAAFRRGTKVGNYSNDENLLRLQSALKGKAKEAVQGLLVSPENVEQVMKTLERRFGRPTLIIESVIEEVRSIPKVKDEKPETLIEFSSAVENFVAVVESLKREQHLMNPTLMKEFVLKLPLHMSMR